MNILTNKKNWPSEYTRGKQIADYLGCRFNEPLGDLKETIIYVKSWPNEEVQRRLKKMPNVWLDLIDSNKMINIARRFPSVGLILLTEIQRDFLSKHIKNRLVVIPEHSCNFEHAIRTRKRIRTVGYVGSPQCFDLDFAQVRASMEQIGLDFQVLICETANDDTRKEVCDFYKRIDIQFAFRLPDKDVRPPIYRNPLKVFNAGSFKIPTVAYPELSYSLCAPTMFLPVNDLTSAVMTCHCLKHDKCLYEFYANRAYVYSKGFSIDKIAKLYAKLGGLVK